MSNLQVQKEHYGFDRYIDMPRWCSYYNQVREVLSLAPKSILEIGPGPGVLKSLASFYGVLAHTVDHDPQIKPDFIESADNLHFDENSYDCVCAFQVLEHFSYLDALSIFRRMVSIAKSSVVISLPNASRKLVFSVQLPILGRRFVHIPMISLRPYRFKFDGQHYWEINTPGHSESQVIQDFSLKGLNLVRQYRLNELPYHHFFVFKKL